MGALRRPNNEKGSKPLARSMSFRKDEPDQELSSLFGKISSFKENPEQIGSRSLKSKIETEELSSKFTQISAMKVKDSDDSRKFKVPKEKAEEPELSGKF